MPDRSPEDFTGSGCERPLTRPTLPLMGLTSLSEVIPANRSASLVPRSPFAVSRRSSPGHGVFLAHRRRVEVEDIRAPPLRGLASPSEYHRAGLPTPSRARRLPGVPAPSACADAGAHSPGICLVPVRVRLQGFSPSCRVSSPASFRPFKAGNAHGVFPFEASPSGRSRGASRRPLPSCRCSHSACAAEAASDRLMNPASGPCSPPESVTIARGLAVRTLDAPLGLRRSRAFRGNVATGFPATPLAGFSAVGSHRRGRPPRVSIRSRGARSSIRRSVGAATLLRFLHLVSAPRTSSLGVPGSRRTVPVHR